MNAADYCQSFQDEINVLAELSGKSVESVLSDWRKYSQECQSFDQSPVMFEFCEWYGYDNLLD